MHDETQLTNRRIKVTDAEVLSHKEHNPFYEAFHTELDAMFDSMVKLNESSRLAREHIAWYVQNNPTVLDTLKTFVTTQPTAQPPYSWRVMVITGVIGGGKTSLVHFFFRHMVHEDKINCTYLITNIALAGPSVEGLRHAIARQIDDQLNTDPAFAFLKQPDEQLKVWSSTFGWDTEVSKAAVEGESPDAIRKKELRTIREHLEKLGSTGDFWNKILPPLRYLIDNGHNVVVVWDNVDSTSQEIQRASIVLAKQFVGEVRNSKVVVCVRPGTMNLFKPTDALSGFKFEVQEIDPPTVQSVIGQRIALVEGRLQGKTARIAVGRSGSSHLIDDAPGFFKRVINTIVSPKHNHILSCLALKSMRLQLQLVRRILSSMHIDIITLLTDHREARSSDIGTPEFLQALIAGPHKLPPSPTNMDSDSCAVVNIFHMQGERKPYPTLVQPYLLRVLIEHGVEGEMQKKALKSTMGAYQFTAEDAELAIKHLGEWRLIEIAEREQAEIVRLTSAGEYYYREMMTERLYLESMAYRTPLAEERISEMEWGEFGEGRTARGRAAWHLVAQVEADEKELLMALNSSDRTTNRNLASAWTAVRRNPEAVRLGSRLERQKDPKSAT